MDFDAIVIGSGFGGAVSALRLSQAGFRVALLERGRRYPRDSFPRNWQDPKEPWFYPHAQGLFDVRSLPAMQVVQSAGYGGGSLIYANVHLRAPQTVFQKNWPKAHHREALDPYYDLVAHMLELERYDASRPDLPLKAQRMQAAARKLKREDQFFFTPIAVKLRDENTDAANRFGVAQRGCSRCGECDIGCNRHSKNSLDHNYLALAERTNGKPGISVKTQCEATSIATEHGGYRVHYRDGTRPLELMSLSAERVFVCGGAINSTELLLRSRPNLERLSDTLGQRFSANGDFLAFVLNTKTPMEAGRGPVITTAVLHDRGKGDDNTWFLLEEGGYPDRLAKLLGLFDAKFGSLSPASAMHRQALERLIEGQAHAGGGNGQGQNAAVFLAMGRDKASGVIRLAPVTRSLCIDWPEADNMPLYAAEEQLANDFAVALGGELKLNPFWRITRVPVSVHNLGGCAMSDHPSDGVTDAKGEVHYYPGLYVLDGSILPTAVGANPSHTIAAVAERNIEAIIREVRRDPAWRAPERAAAPPFDDPLTRIIVPVGGTPEPVTPTTGLSFTETMKGHVHRGQQPVDDYRGGETAGKSAGTRVEFTLTITTTNLHRFLIDKYHSAGATGRIFVSGITEPRGAPVNGGLFNLFVETEASNKRRMLYLLPFIGADGKEYYLDGFKRVEGNWTSVWPATTTLYVRIFEGKPDTDADHSANPVVASGVMHILPLDFARQMTTFRVSGTDAPDRQIEAFARFSQLFLGTLGEVFLPRLHRPAAVRSLQQLHH
jgi:cholesterol oxidase